MVEHLAIGPVKESQQHAATWAQTTAKLHQCRIQRLSAAVDEREPRKDTTLDTYSDLFDDDLDAVAESLERVWTNSLADYLRTTSDSGDEPAKSAAA